MFTKDIDNLINKYYEHVDFVIKLNNLRAKSRTFDSQLKKYISNRKNQIGTFLEDGKILYHLEGIEDLSCSNPKSKRGCIQYYNLEKNELLAYFGFRSKLRKNELPKNSQISFLVIYLMEILNDFYTLNFEDKRNKLNQVSKLYNKGAKYKNLIKEANEVLYFQCPDNLTLSGYKLKYNITNIFEGYSENSLIFNKYDYIFNIAKKGIELNKIDEYLIKNSFIEILKEATEKDFCINLDGNEIKISEGLTLDYGLKFSLAINKLYSLYPLHIDRTLYEKSGKRIRVYNGLLMNENAPKFNIEIIKKVIEFSKNSFRKILNGPISNQKEDSSFSNSYFLRNKFSNFNNEKDIYSLIQEWVIKNKYCKDAYNSTIANMEFNKQKDQFLINFEEVKTVRNKSAIIQNKLIIEDEVVDVSKNNLELVNEVVNSTNEPISYFKNINISNKMKNTDEFLNNTSGKNSMKIDIKTENSGVSSNNSNNSYELMVKELSKLELSILNKIAFEDIEGASEIARKENIMLSLVVENINLKSNKYLDDIIIEDLYIIDDYKKQIVDALFKE